jgi:ubiquitin C-terminal hydrolase
MEKEQNISYEKANLGRFNNSTGSLCYMIANMHVLLNAPILLPYIITGSYHESIKKKAENKSIQDDSSWEDNFKDNVIYELHRCLGLAHQVTDNRTQMTPTSFRRIVSNRDSMWGENRHQDAQEFLSFLLNKISEEAGEEVEFLPGLYDSNVSLDPNISINNSLLRLTALSTWQKYIKKEYSPMTRMFTGMTHSSLKCAKCGHNSHSFEPFTTFPVEIPYDSSTPNEEFTLVQCLKNMTKGEKLDSDNMIECNMCGLKNRAVKKLTVCKTPDILIFQFKRFIKNMYGIASKKITNKIDYPLRDLDLSDFLSSASTESSKYDLFGVINHKALLQEGNLSLGHYTALVKHISNNHWYLFNDSAKPELIKRISDIKHKDAYLLFYIRKN